MRLVRESGKSVGAVARELDLAETAVRRWVVLHEFDGHLGSSRSSLRPLPLEGPQLRDPKDEWRHCQL